MNTSHSQFPDHHNKFGCAQIAGALLLAAFLIVCIALVVQTPRPAISGEATVAAASPSTPTPIPAPEPLHWITASYLSTIYHSGNEVAADSIFKGKRFAIKGVVKDVSKDFLDKIWLHLYAGPGMFDNLEANFPPESADQVATLRPGQSVIISCRGDGLMMDTVMLKSCSVIDESALGSELQ